MKVYQVFAKDWGSDFPRCIYEFKASNLTDARQMASIRWDCGDAIVFEKGEVKK